MRSLGCEYAQGFYYGQPMSERDALQLTRLVAKSEKKMGRRVHKLGPSKPAANGKEPEPVAAASTRANTVTPAEPRTRGSRPPAGPPQGPAKGMTPPPAQMPPPNGAHSQTIPPALRGKGAGITLPQPPPSAAPVTVPLGRNGSGVTPPLPNPPPPPRPAADAGANGRAPLGAMGASPLPMPPMPQPMPPAASAIRRAANAPADAVGRHAPAGRSQRRRRSAATVASPSKACSSTGG